MALAAVAGGLVVYAAVGSGSGSAETSLPEPAAVRPLTYSGDDGLPAATLRLALESQDRDARPVRRPAGLHRVVDDLPSVAPHQPLAIDAVGVHPPPRGRPGAQPDRPSARPWARTRPRCHVKAGVWRMRPDGSDAERLVEGGYIQSEVSHDGRWAGFLLPEAQNLRARLRVVEVETGRLVPFELVISGERVLSENVLLGRMRWVSDCPLAPTPAIAFLGIDEQGRSGIYLQDFDPEQDTTATRRAIAGFDEHLLTESFDISPDGTRITLALLEVRRRLMLAEGVKGIEAPQPAN